MTDHFRQHAAGLIAAGYFVVPIRQGEKRPALAGWQNARLSAADAARYPEHGLGVLCGQGEHPVVGIDLDVSHPAINTALVSWCENHLGYSPQRVGDDPRILLAYRASCAGWSKGRSIQWFDPTDPVKASGKRNVQQVEILSLGQQFVAYHVHPDTHNEYDWVDMLGGLLGTAAHELPVITEDQLDALLVEVSRLVRSTPGLRVEGTADAPAVRSSSADDDLSSLSTRVGKPFDEVEDIVGYLPNDGDSYDMWLNVGAALHHEFFGTPHEQQALQLWRDYGARSAKDDPKQYDYKWRSFGKNTGRSTTLRWLLKIAHVAKGEHEHSAKLQQMEQFQAVLKEQDDLVKLGSKKVLDRLRDLFPSDMLLRDQAFHALQVRHQEISGNKLGIEKARLLLQGPRTKDVASKRALTEFGNMERMLDRYGDGLMYVPETDQWYSWTGVYWRKAPLVEIDHFAQETIRALHDEIEFHQEDNAKEFYQFCALSQTAKMVRSVVQLAQASPRVVVPARELDKDRNYLGVLNGMVDLRTGDLLPADPEMHMTLCCSCEYQPGAKAPLFLRTLREAFFDKDDMVQYMLSLFGYSLLGQPVEDLMVIPHGRGANGKSTIFGAVRHMLGSYARSVDPATFISDGKSVSNGGGAREDLVRLLGARFIYVNESDENGELREGSVKTMTGNDTITARTVFGKSSVEIDPTWVVFMPTNHRPIIKGDDHGIWRRIETVPFERNFSADPNITPDPKMRDKVRAEAPGILAVLVQAALRYRREGLVRPEGVRASKAAYRDQMDLLSEWLDECCDVTPQGETPMSQLWQSWERFAKNRGMLGYIRSSTALGRRLESRFPARKGTGGLRMRVGVVLKSAPEGL